jgi:hypothetical protein
MWSWFVSMITGGAPIGEPAAKPARKPQMKAAGQPLHVNPSFTVDQRLERSVVRLRKCKTKLGELSVDDPRRPSWESEARQRRYEIDKYGGM